MNVLTSRRYPDWFRHSRLTREAIMATEDDMPWSTKPGIVLRGVPQCDRSIDVINVAWLYRLHQTGALTEQEELAARVIFLWILAKGCIRSRGPRASIVYAKGKLVTSEKCKVCLVTFCKCEVYLFGTLRESLTASGLGRF